MISRIGRAKTWGTSAVSMRAAVLTRPWAADPDVLRQAIQESLSSLTDDQRAGYNRRLTTALVELGLNIPSILYISGVVEQEPADLTPSEVAHLFRYIRINLPWVLFEAEDLFAGLGQKKETSRKVA